jgi:hypothetical protein
MLTAPRKIQERPGTQGGHPILAGSPTIHQGALVILKAGSATPAREGEGADNAAKAAEATTFVAVGIAEKTVTVSDGRVPTRAGCFLFDNKGDDAITRADIGRPAYAFDDHTVARTSPNNIRAKAGTIVDVEDSGVWVRVGV